MANLLGKTLYDNKLLLYIRSSLKIAYTTMLFLYRRALYKIDHRMHLLMNKETPKLGKIELFWGSCLSLN